jgi:cyclopropane fatty-acyl-phospholipid synthase-like methyltransferase
MRALVVGDGEGRNGVWLAKQGLDVLSVDASAVGMDKARRLASSCGVTLRTETVDLTAWAWPTGEYDVVVSIFLHFPPVVRARLHAAMLTALKPGGVLILEAFTPEQLKYKSGGPPVREMLYTADMLRADFNVQGGTNAAGAGRAGAAGGAELMLLEETLTDLDEGPYHRGRAAVVRLVAKRQ